MYYIKSMENKGFKMKSRILARITIFFIYSLIMVTVLSLVCARQYIDDARQIDRIVYDNNIVTVSQVSFKVTDTSSNNINRAAVIIQGIDDASFSTRGVTDNTGSVSFNLESQKLYQWTIYKTGFDVKTGFLFVVGNSNQNVQLSPVSPDKWYSYYEQDGNIEVIMTSFDKSTKYIPGDLRNFQIEANNIASENIELDAPNTLIKTVESNTSYRVAWWGSLLPKDIQMVLTLKPNGGWIRITSQNGINKVCTGKSFGTRLDTNQNFDLSGSEFICIENPASVMDAEVPAWIPTDAYKMIASIAYKKNGIPNNIVITTQDFYVNNTVGWSPHITSTPSLDAEVNKVYTYTLTVEPLHINITQDTSFFEYYLLKGPSGMTINSKTRTISWTPTAMQQGTNTVKLEVKHTFFSGDPQSRGFSKIQEFNITVKAITNDNLYPYNSYTYNDTVKPNDLIIVQFKIVNNADIDNAVSWKIDKGDGTSINSVTAVIPAHQETIVWTGIKYITPGVYVPSVTVNYDKKTMEANYDDNTINFAPVTILGGGNGQTIRDDIRDIIVDDVPVKKDKKITENVDVKYKSVSKSTPKIKTNNYKNDVKNTKKKVLTHYEYGGNDPSKKKDYYVME